MPTLELRPLSLGELLDRTFYLYRANFWVFVGIMAIPAFFSIPFNALYYSLRGTSIFRPSGVEMVAGLIVGFFVFIILLLLVYAVAIGAATCAVSEVYLGQPASVRGSYKKVRHKLGKIVGLSLSVLLRVLGMGIAGAIAIGIVVAGAVALIGMALRGNPNPAIPVILGVVAVIAYFGLLLLFNLWALRYAVSIPALLLEDLGISAAIRRSVQLTEGRKWQILVAIVVMVMMTYVGVIIFQVPFLVVMGISAVAGAVPAWLAFAAAISGAIGGALTGPLLMITLVLVYYDSRIRKEGFDLQFMMSSLDAVPAPSAALPG